MATLNFTVATKIKYTLAYRMFKVVCFVLGWAHPAYRYKVTRKLFMNHTACRIYCNGKLVKSITFEYLYKS